MNLYESVKRNLKEAGLPSNMPDPVLMELIIRQALLGADGESMPNEYFDMMDEQITNQIINVAKNAEEIASAERWIRNPKNAEYVLASLGGDKKKLDTLYEELDNIYGEKPKTGLENARVNTVKESENKFDPKNVKASVMLTYELEDDDTPTGGISWWGEQIKDFLDSAGIAKNTTISELNKALKDNGIKPITAEDIKRYMNKRGVKEAESKDKPYILSEKEYDVIDKVMTNSGMIDAYFIGNYDADGWDQEKNGDAWWDFENDERISMEDGLSYMAEGFTSAEDYDLTASEYKTLQRLCAKFDVSI